MVASSTAASIYGFAWTHPWLSYLHKRVRLMRTLYQDLEEIDVADKGFLLVMMHAPPAFEEEFNAWYDTEHLPSGSLFRGSRPRGVSFARPAIHADRDRSPRGPEVPIRKYLRITDNRHEPGLKSS